MKTIIPVSSFDWDGFLEETLKNLENMVADKLLVVRQVDKHVELYEDGWKDLDLLEDLRGDNVRLFVQFAVDNLDNAVVLADGTTKLYVDPTVVCPEDEDAYEKALDEARQHMYCSQTESVGFVFEREGDNLIITTGWYVGDAANGPPTIDILVNNEELDFYGYAMERYIDQFMLS